MKAELKIGILIGVVVVVGVIVYFARQGRSPGLESPQVEVTVPQAEDQADTEPVVVVELEPMEPAVSDIADEPETAEDVAESVEQDSETATDPEVSAEESAAVTAEIDTSVPQEPTRPASRYYAVKKGDTLGNIALQYYGSSQLWKVVYEANRQIIKSPDSLREGWKLRIPYAEEVEASYR